MSIATNYTLEADSSGTEVTLGGLGIERVVVVQSVRGEDSMTIIAPLAAMTSATLFSAGQSLVLRSPDGTRRFAGTVERVTRSYTAGQFRQMVKVDGGHALLYRSTFQDSSQFVTSPGTFGSATAGGADARVVQNLDPSDNSKRSLDGELTRIFATVSGAGVNTSALTAVGLQPPERELTANAWGLVQAQMEWAPHFGTRWEYSATDAEMTVVRLSQGRDLTVTNLQELTATPRADLLVRQVTVRQLGTQTATNSGTGETESQLIKDEHTTADAANGGRVIVRQFNRRPAVYSASRTVLYGQEPLASLQSLAEALQERYGNVITDLSASYVRDDVDWTPRVGDRLSVAGYGSELAAARSPILQISRDLFRGTTSITAGADGRDRNSVEHGPLIKSQADAYRRQNGTETNGSFGPAAQEPEEDDLENVQRCIDGALETWTLAKKITVDGVDYPIFQPPAA